MSLGTGPTNEGRCDADTPPPQPTVLVTGSGGHRLRSVANGLFVEGMSACDGAVVVTTQKPPTTLTRQVTSGQEGIDPANLAVVDARGDEYEPAVGRVRRVAPDVDPTAMDEVVSGELARLGERGVKRRHFLYDILTTDSGLPDDEAAYDRAYRLAMTVGAEEGLALFTLHGERFSEDVVDDVGHLFDVRVELREFQGGTELRWTGLLGASEGWVDLRNVDLGVDGFR